MRKQLHEMGLAVDKSGLYLLLLLLSILLLANLGSPPLYILDEVKNAQCAREMMERHDWIIPTFNDRLRTDKPPLHYFFMIVAYGVFGINAFAARFFSAIACIATIFITWQFAKKYLGTTAAFYSVLTLLSSTHFLFEFRLSVPDPYLILFVTIGLFSSYNWLNEGQIKSVYIAAAAFAFATLVKGPVGIALPGLCILVWIIWKKNWKPVFTRHFVLAGILFLVLTVPWFAAVHKATSGAWTRSFFLEHNLKRFSEPMEGHGGWFLLIPLFFLAGLLPFSSYVVEIFRKRRNIFNNPVLQFAAVVVFVFIIFFSFSGTKLPNYTMPCYPFAGIILGNYFGYLEKQNHKKPSYPYYILLGIGLLLPMLGYFAIQNEILTTDLAWLAWLISLIPVLMLALLLLSNKGSENLIRNIAIGWLALNLLGLQVIYPSLYRRNPVAQTMSLIKQAPAVYGYVIINPAYVFYMKKRISVTNNVDTLKKWLSSSPRALVITRAGIDNELKNLPLQKVSEKHNLFESSTTTVYQYTPNQAAPSGKDPTRDQKYLARNLDK